MPDPDKRDDKNFRERTPPVDHGFFLKGGQYDWGMKNRLARIFRPETGRTVMLAFNHGYFQGPATDLERVDLNIVPIAPHADALMLTRGIVRSTIRAAHRGGIVDARAPWPEHPQGPFARADRARHGGRRPDERTRRRGPGLRRRRTRDRVRREYDEARRRGLSLRRPRARRDGSRTRVERDARRLGLATRIRAELGAQVVKTYYCAEGFERVTARCPAPIVLLAGGKKVPELEALEMAHRAVVEGAAGLDMGRNIFQLEAPAAMLQAVAAIVHDGLEPTEAHEMFRELSHRLVEGVR